MIFRYGSKYGSNDVEVRQYNTKQEKEILVMLMQTINHVHFSILDEALKILLYSPDEISKFSDFEKRIILLKCRELSVGDDISFNFKCGKCKAINQSVLRVDDFFINKLDNNQQPLKFRGFKIVDAFIEADNISIHEYLKNEDGGEVDEDVIDEMDSITYEDIYDEIKNHTLQFRNSITGYCSCGHHVPIKLSDRFVVENMSEDSIQSIYKTYSDLIYFGNYSKYDIDTLVPFERTIFVGMLNATKKETTT